MIELKSKIIDYKDKQTGELKQIRSFYVVINDVEIPLKACDYTGNQFLNKYFEKKGE